MVGFGVPAQQFCPRAERDASTHPTKGRAIAYGSLLGGGNARAACSTSPRVRGEVDLRAEPWRREANRVRGLVHKLRPAATPPHPDSFAALGIRPLPARGERWRMWLCLAPQDTNSNAIALLTNWGGPDRADQGTCCRHVIQFQPAAHSTSACALRRKSSAKPGSPTFLASTMPPTHRATSARARSCARGSFKWCSKTVTICSTTSW